MCVCERGRGAWVGRHPGVNLVYERIVTWRRAQTWHEKPLEAREALS